MWKKAVAVLCGLVLVLTACGGSDKRLTKAEFTSQANAICKKGNADLDKAGEAAFKDGQPTAAKFRAFIDDELVPTVSDQLDKIDELSPPKDLQDDVDGLLTDARAALKDVKAKAKSDPEKLMNADDPFADVNKKADALGLKECGSGG